MIHEFVGKYYADIMTLFALIAPFLLIFYNQIASKKSQLNENSERWMERLRQAATEFTQAALHQYSLKRDSTSLFEELNKYPGNLALLPIRVDRREKTFALDSALLGAKIKINLLFSEESDTLKSLNEIIESCITLANQADDDGELFDKINDFLAVIDSRLDKEWKKIAGKENKYAISILGILLALFITTSFIAFAEIGKLKMASQMTLHRNDSLCIAVIPEIDARIDKVEAKLKSVSDSSELCCARSINSQATKLTKTRKQPKVPCCDTLLRILEKRTISISN